MKRAATDEACHIARQKAIEREIVGRSIKMARGRPKKGTAPGPQFGAAAKRKKLYLSSAGLRAFHVGWSSVSKSSIARGAFGTRVYANAAAVHVDYIEDGAIVRLGHTVYIDSSRVETRPDGERLVLSNISSIYEERIEFFQLVDQFERVNHGDTVEIDFEANAESWRAVIEDPNCDPAIQMAYADWAANIKRAKKEPIALKGSGSNLRMVMKDHGFVFADPIVNEERFKRDGFCFHDGRGGRTEYRLVFELPREFNYEQRAEALGRLCLQFKNAGCMYVAVIHAPDPHNDEDNHHIHLDFYDRKCRRLDGTDADLMHVKKQFEPFVEAEMKNGLYREQVRDRVWDFTVKRTYPSNKCTKTHFPFGATHKSAAVRDIRFVAKVRKAFAADINAVAREAGLGDLYDPRSYAAMGMNCPASKKLGPAAHGLETKGVPTKVGLDNEAAQALFEMQMIERAHQDEGRQLDAIQFDLQKASQDLPVELAASKVAVDEELENAKLATDVRRDLALLQLERERERSRAMLVSGRQGRASRAGTPAAQFRSANLAQSADHHLADLDQRDLGLVIDIAALDAFAVAHGPEQAVRAISEFKQAKLRHHIEHDLGILLPGQIAEDGRRDIMTKRGTLVAAGNHPSQPINLPGDPDSVPPERILIVESDKSLTAASPVTDANSQSDAPATPVTATDDLLAKLPPDLKNLVRARSTLGAQQLRYNATQSAAMLATDHELNTSGRDGMTKPLTNDESQIREDQPAEPNRVSAQSGSPVRPGQAPEQSGTQPAASAADCPPGSEADLQTALVDQLLTPPSDFNDGASVAVSIDKLGGAGVTTHDQDPTNCEHREAPDSAEHTGANFLMENDHWSASADSNERSVTAEHDTINNARSVNNVDAATDDVIKSDPTPEPLVGNGGPAEIPFDDRSADEVANHPPHGTPAFPEQEEIREILRPRRVGPDGVFHVVDLPAGAPNTFPAIVAHHEELDPITVAKLLWAYDDISDSAKAALPKIEKQLYSSATNNALADELRLALSKGRQNQRAAVRETELALQVRPAEAASIDLDTDSSRYNDQHAQAALQAQFRKGRA